MLSAILGKSEEIYRHPDVEPHRPLLDNLKLTSSELAKLHKVFSLAKGNRLDNSVEESILSNKLLDRSDPLFMRLLSYYDSEGDGLLDFLDFVLCLWSFLTTEGLNLGLLVFDLYRPTADEDHVLSKAGLDQMVQDMFPDVNSVDAYKVIDGVRSADIGKDGMTIEKFLSCAESWGLLKPVYELQQRLRCKVCGVNFWMTLSHKKVGGVLTHGKFVAIRDFVRQTARRNSLSNSKKAVSSAATSSSRKSKKNTRHRRMSSSVSPNNDDDADDEGVSGVFGNSGSKNKPSNSSSEGIMKNHTIFAIFDRFKRGIEKATGAHHQTFYANASVTIRAMKTHFKAMQLQEPEVSKLYDYFTSIDARKSGSLQQRDLEAYHLIGRAPIDSRIFEVWDMQHKTSLDFLIFIMRLWDLCTGDRTVIARFSFEVFDRDGDGVLGNDDIKQMLVDVYGTNHQEDMRARGMSVDIETNNKRKNFITKAFFVEFSKNHPELLEPFEKLQKNLIRLTMGAAFWQTHTTRRHQLVLDGCNLTVEDILRDPKAAWRLVKDPLRSRRGSAQQQQGNNNRMLEMGALAMAVADAAGQRATINNSYAVGSEEWKQQQMSDVRRLTQTYASIPRGVIREAAANEKKEQKEKKTQQLIAFQDELEAAEALDKEARQKISGARRFLCYFFTGGLFHETHVEKLRRGKRTYVSNLVVGGGDGDGGTTTADDANHDHGNAMIAAAAAVYEGGAQIATASKEKGGDEEVDSRMLPDIDQHMKNHTGEEWQDTRRELTADTPPPDHNLHHHTAWGLVKSESPNYHTESDPISTGVDTAEAFAAITTPRKLSTEGVSAPAVVLPTLETSSWDSGRNGTGEGSPLERGRTFFPSEEEEVMQVEELSDDDNNDEQDNDENGEDEENVKEEYEHNTTKTQEHSPILVGVYGAASEHHVVEDRLEDKQRVVGGTTRTERRGEGEERSPLNKPQTPIVVATSSISDDRNMIDGSGNGNSIFVGDTSASTVTSYLAGIPAIGMSATAAAAILPAANESQVGLKPNNRSSFISRVSFGLIGGSTVGSDTGSGTGSVGVNNSLAGAPSFNTADVPPTSITAAAGKSSTISGSKSSIVPGAKDEYGAIPAVVSKGVGDTQPTTVRRVSVKPAAAAPVPVPTSSSSSSLSSPQSAGRGGRSNQKNSSSPVGCTSPVEMSTRSPKPIISDRRVSTNTNSKTQTPLRRSSLETEEQQQLQQQSSLLYQRRPSVLLPPPRRSSGEYAPHKSSSGLTTVNVVSSPYNYDTTTTTDTNNNTSTTVVVAPTPPIIAGGGGMSLDRRGSYKPAPKRPSAEFPPGQSLLTSGGPGLLRNSLGTQGTGTGNSAAGSTQLSPTGIHPPSGISPIDRRTSSFRPPAPMRSPPIMIMPMEASSPRTAATTGGGGGTIVDAATAVDIVGESSLPSFQQPVRRRSSLLTSSITAARRLSVEEAAGAVDGGCTTPIGRQGRRMSYNFIA